MTLGPSTRQYIEGLLQQYLGLRRGLVSRPHACQT